MLTTGENETVLAGLIAYLDDVEIFDVVVNLGPNSIGSYPFSDYMSPFLRNRFVVPGEHTLTMMLGWSPEDIASTSVTYTALPPTITLEGEYSQSVCDKSSIMDDLNISGELCGDVGSIYDCVLTVEIDGVPSSKYPISTSLPAGQFDWAYVAPFPFLYQLLTPGVYNIGVEIIAETDGAGQYTPFTEPYPSAYLTIETVQSCGQQQVSIDIKPGSCPNPFNVKSKGVLPVAILGTNELDVNDIDVATIRLSGVAAVRSGLEDVGIPSELDDCNDLGSDGIIDLTLKFSTQDIVAALGPVVDDDEIVLTLTGTLKDETEIIKGEDTVVIINKVKKRK